MWQLVLGAALVAFAIKSLIDWKAQGFLLSWRDDPQAGKVWGKPDGLPEGWDPDRNSVWVDPSCEWAIEGRKFLPVWNAEVSNLPIGRGGSLVEVLDFSGAEMPRGDNPAWGMVDQLASEGLDAKTIADTIFAEAAPLCWDAGPSAWGSGVKAWYADLLARIEARIGDE